MLKAASEINIIDSMTFDDRSKSNLSSIHSGSQDDLSHDSESTDDLSLDNWAGNSGLLDKTFSRFLSSSSRAQPPLDLIHGHLRCKGPGSTPRVNNVELSCENNAAVSADIKRRSQVKWTLICEIDTNRNHQDNEILTSVLMIRLLRHFHLHRIRMHHFHLTKLLLLQNLLRN